MDKNQQKYGSSLRKDCSKITEPHWVGMDHIRNRKELQVVLSDKTLGPIVVSMDGYITSMDDQYLSNRKTHAVTSKQEAQEHFLEATNTFMRHVSL